MESIYSTHILTEHEVDKAAQLLKGGHIVAFPTETVYGLGAPIFSEKTIAKIFKAKGRPSDNPLIAHVSSLAMVESIATELPEEFYPLFSAFFPGPLTVVVKKHPKVPPLVSAGLDTIALRMPSHKTALALIEKVGEPIVAPSANLSGKPSATDFRHVLDDFMGKIAAVIAAEPAEIGIESTVISLLSSPPVILRPGRVTANDIAEVLGHHVTYHPSIQGGEAQGSVASPGMKYRHYAPRAKVLPFFCKEAMLGYIGAQRDKKLLVLSHNQITARQLYALFRGADDDLYDEIIMHCDPSIQNDVGLMNRIIKASQA